MHKKIPESARIQTNNHEKLKKNYELLANVVK